MRALRAGRRHLVVAAFVLLALANTLAFAWVHSQVVSARRDVAEVRRCLAPPVHRPRSDRCQRLYDQRHDLP